jgi:hypothetical protein
MKITRNLVNSFVAKTMNNRVILKDNGKARVKVEVSSNSDYLLTMINGRQWTGQPLTPELAKLTISALEEYIDTKK